MEHIKHINWSWNSIILSGIVGRTFSQNKCFYHQCALMFILLFIFVKGRYWWFREERRCYTDNFCMEFWLEYLWQESKKNLNINNSEITGISLGWSWYVRAVKAILLLVVLLSCLWSPVFKLWMRSLAISFSF